MGGQRCNVEDIITNFELVGTRILRICPSCNDLQDRAYDLSQEQAVLWEQRPNCGFHFPYLTEQPSSFGVFKDFVDEPVLATKASDSPNSATVTEPA